jgi:hypothetical protein
LRTRDGISVPRILLGPISLVLLRASHSLGPTTFFLLFPLICICICILIRILTSIHHNLNSSSVLSLAHSSPLSPNARPCSPHHAIPLIYSKHLVCQLFLFSDGPACDLFDHPRSAVSCQHPASSRPAARGTHSRSSPRRKKSMGGGGEG